MKSVTSSLVIVLVVVLAAGCSQPRKAVQLVVSPGAVRADEPVTVRVSHLKPGASVVLSVRSLDASGTTWTSEATFTADPDGAVDPALSAPTAGNYAGVWGMDLFSSMDPSAAGASAYRWPTSGAATFEFSVLDGDHRLATVATTRTMWPQAPSVETFTVDRDGFAGTYVKPAGVRRGPAVLVLGGSEGGDPAYGATILAARGIPALSVAYFKAPGLPKQLANIPLEYFDNPLRWLRRQPEVDPAQLWISGASRGSEAAALVAVEHPGVVHGLLDLSPSSTVHCAYIPSGHQQCPSAPAWRRHGEPVVSTEEADNPAPDDRPGAVIPVEKITGPVLTLCGGSDLLWDSCRFSDAVNARLQDRSSPYPRLELRYPDAGHAVDFPMPYQPMPPRPAGSLPTNGSTPTANEQARADAWPRLLAFIRTPG